MFSTDDTIVAISTPLGRAGLGVVRLSGSAAAQIGCRLIGRSAPLTPRHATFAKLAQELPTPVPTGTVPQQGTSVPAARRGVGDQVVVTYFVAPHSSTGEDVVEISAHGSPVVLQAIVEAAMRGGARLAQPGEFTLRAYLNGKLDLIQAEAVADLIDAVTPLQARAAFDQLEGTLTSRIAEIESALFDLMARLEASLDFPDEGYHFVQREAAAVELRALDGRIHALLADAGRGRLVREGVNVAIIGTPNVGKSSLFNALLNANRAIVTPVAGTTRDLLTERADIRGIAVSLVDTAGIRPSDDVVEREGISRAHQALTVADLALLVLDRSRPMTAHDKELLERDMGQTPRVIVANKCDLQAAWSPADVAADIIEISVINGQGLAELVARMATALGVGDDHRDRPLVSNTRHASLLLASSAAVSRAHHALTESNNDISEEFVLSDLQEASAALQEITGRRTTDDLLAHIFERFCIGK